ncbi:unnamed protein product, partial [Clonostachys chloroleuca]
TSTGRRCDGYGAEVSTRGLGYRNSRPSLSVNAPNSGESLYLQFFVEKTLLSFQAFFPDELWHTRALQLAQSESSIRHGLVALASYHHGYVHQQGSESSEFALSQYNMAIKELTRCADGTSRHPEPHLQVLACLIFISIEILRGKIKSAINLFQHGCQMMWQLKRTQASRLRSGSEMERTFYLAEAFFRRLAVQISMVCFYHVPKLKSDTDSSEGKLVGDVSPELSTAFHARSSNSDFPSPFNFRNLVVARETLLNIIIRSSMQSELRSDRICYAEQIQQWIQSFNSLVSRLSIQSLSKAEKRGIALLELHKRNLSLNLAGMAHDTESMDDDFFWDQYVADFEEMIPYAAVAVGLDTYDTDFGDSSKASWHMEIGVTPVLFQLIARCRDPLVRRKAIAIMLADQMQEGVWNSFLAARVAKILVEVEENGKQVLSGHEIHVTRRVRTVQVQLESGDRQAKVQYANRYGSLEHYISW